MDTICRMIGFFIGCAIGISKSIIMLLIKYLPRLLTVIFKFIWRGIVTASKRYKIIIVLYIALAVITVVLIPSPRYILINTFILEGYQFMLIVDLLVITFFSVFEYIKDYPRQKLKRAFRDIFTDIGLYTDENLIPEYLNTEYPSPYLACFVFRSLTPLSLWFGLKEAFEMYANIKIYDIVQSPDNLRIIRVLVHRNPLPEQISWKDEYLNQNSNVLNIGVGYYGIAGMDLEKYPHAFIAGETGSGKSNILKCMIYQSILKGYKTVLIDFKRGVSFSAFNEVIDVYYEYDTVISILEDMVGETKNRLDLFRESRVDNINDYNKVSGKGLKRIIIYIDELAELLKTRDKAIAHALNDSIETLTRLSRAAGIHLIMGIQRPDSTIVNGQIKNNAPFRICGRFTDREPSRIMLANDMASSLPNIKGRFLIKDDNLVEVQCFYFNFEADNITPDPVSKVEQPSEKLEEDIHLEAPEQVATQEPLSEFYFNFDDIKRVEK